MSAENTENVQTAAVEPTVEQRLARALSTTEARSQTALFNKIGKPRVAKAKLEAALDGMVKGGAVALIPPPALPEGAKRGRGRPVVAKFLGLVAAPMASTPAGDAPAAQ